MKDNFSVQAQQYAQFRPSYPKAFYDFVLANCTQTNIAWDCATGNGQVAMELSKVFGQVFATDISAKQLAHAPQKNNITYKVEQAEQTAFSNHQFDLITVAQAIHWFNFDVFYQEVKRTLKPTGLFVVVGYGLLQIDERINKVIQQLYSTILGSYWDKERQYIDENYQTIPFPFSEIESPALEISTQWDFNQLIGYLETWSALQHYLKTNAKNPINDIIGDLKEAWGSDNIKPIHFPLLIRAGRLQ